MWTENCWMFNDIEYIINENLLLSSILEQVGDHTFTVDIIMTWALKFDKNLFIIFKNFI